MYFMLELVQYEFGGLDFLVERQVFRQVEGLLVEIAI